MALLTTFVSRWSRRYWHCRLHNCMWVNTTLCNHNEEPQFSSLNFQPCYDMLLAPPSGLIGCFGFVLCWRNVWQQQGIQSCSLIWWITICLITVIHYYSNIRNWRYHKQIGFEPKSGKQACTIGGGVRASTLAQLESQRTKCENMRIKQIGFELKAGKQACKIGGGARAWTLPQLAASLCGVWIYADHRHTFNFLNFLHFIRSLLFLYTLWSVDLCRPLTHLQLLNKFTLYM